MIAPRNVRRMAALARVLQGNEGLTGVAMIAVSTGLVAMMAIRTAGYVLRSWGWL